MLLPVSEVTGVCRCTDGCLCRPVSLRWGWCGGVLTGGEGSGEAIGTDPASTSERGMVFCRLSINPALFSCGNADACMADFDLGMLGFFF